MRPFFKLALAIVSSATTLFAAHDVTPPTFGPAAYPLAAPIVASNGEKFLAAWTMTVANIPSKWGSVIAGDTREVSPVSYPVALPASAYLLIRHGRDYAAFADTPTGVASLTIISEDGLEVRSTRVLPGVQRVASAASNGSEILIAAGPSSAAILMVPSNGSLVRLDITASFATSVTSAGSDFVVATTMSATGLQVARISSAGTLLPPGKILVSTAVWNAVGVASSGDEIVVVFNTPNGPSPGPFQIPPLALKSASVSRSGAVVIHDLDTKPQGLQPLWIVWAENSYVALGSRTVYRLDHDGVLMSSAAVDFTADARLAGRGNMAYIVGQFDPFTSAGFDDSNSIFGIAVRAGERMDVSAPVMLSVTLRRQIDAALTSNGFDFFCAWTDDERIRSRVGSMRVSRFGERLDANQRNLVELRQKVLGKRLVFGRSRYLLLNTAIAGEREDVLLAQMIDGVWNGDRFFTVTGTIKPSEKIAEVLGVFVSEDGTSSAATRIATMPFQPNPPRPFGLRIAFDGNRYLVIWIYGDQTGNDSGIGDVYAVRVASNGTPIDAQPVLIAKDVRRASVASNGVGFAVVADSIHGDVTLYPVDATVGRPLPIFRWFTPDFSSNVTFDGRDYVVAWRYGVGSAAWWIAMARASTGTATPPFGTRAGIAEDDSPPALASNRVGDTIAVVSEVPSLPGVARVRAYVDRELHPLPSPPLAPSDVIATRTSIGFVIHWSSTDASVDGFIIENDDRVLAVLAADARIFDFGSLPRDISIRAFNAAGASAPISLSIPRRRAV